MIPFESGKVMLARKTGFSRIIPPAHAQAFFTQIGTDSGGFFMFLSSLLADESKWYPVLFDSVLNTVRAVCFWLTVALALAFVVCALVLKGEKRAKFLKISLIFFLVYACAVGITLLAFTFFEDAIQPILFAPILALLLAVAASAIVLAFKRNKMTYIITGCIVGAALVATLVCMGIHFASGDAADINGTTNEEVNSVGLTVSAAILTCAVIAAAFLFGRNDRKGFDSKSIAYAAVCIAMSFALSYLRIVKMPQGGSITIASLLPLMIYAYMFGTKKGVLAGFVYGVLQAFQDPTILHPAQFLLDYPVAFACIGLAGTFATTKALEKAPQVQFLLGAVVAGLCRFVMHFFSGMFAFGMWAPEGQPVWLYSLTYQAAYVLPDIAIAIVAGIIVFSSPSFVKQARKFNVVKVSGEA